MRKSKEWDEGQNLDTDHYVQQCSTVIFLMRETESGIAAMSWVCWPHMRAPIKNCPSVVTGQQFSKMLCFHPQLKHILTGLKD